MDETLKIDVERGQAGTVVALVGEATAEQAERLGKTLMELASQPVKCLVVDLSGLSYISSIGLGVLVSASVRCRRRQIRFAIARPAGKVMTMLAMTRLTGVFQICDTVDDALNPQLPA
jgi:anti-sigma B factor antagonist